jgi:hypothetical protein
MRYWRAGLGLLHTPSISNLSYLLLFCPTGKWQTIRNTGHAENGIVADNHQFSTTTNSRPLPDKTGGIIEHNAKSANQMECRRGDSSTKPFYENVWWPGSGYLCVAPVCRVT